MNHSFLRQIDAELIVTALIIVMILAAEIGFRVGLRRPSEDLMKGVDVVEGALLTLLGLLLAFGVSMAESRYMARTQRLLLEADTIGTSYLRADLLRMPRRSELKKGIREYLSARVAFYELPFESPSLEPLKLRTNELETRIWKQVIDYANENPLATGNILIANSINEMLDVRTQQEALFNIQMPKSINYLLLIASALVVGLNGYSYGLSRKRHQIFTTILASVVGMTLFVLLDLDRNRRGFIRISPKVLLDLQAEINRDLNQSK